MKLGIILIIIIVIGILPMPVKAPIVSNIQITLVENTSDYNILSYSDRIENKYVYTNQVLCEAHMPFILDINLATTIALEGNNLANLLAHAKVGEFNDITITYKVLINESIWTNITVYDNEIIDKKNKTIIGYESHLEQVRDYHYVWKNLSLLDTLTIKQNDFLVLDIVGYVKADINNHFSIDIIPTLKLAEYQRTLSEYAWWDANWDYYLPIWIDSDFVGTQLYNFPLFINITDSDILTNSLANGDDIRFVTANNATEYYFEKEFYSQTRFGLFWVNVTVLNGSAHPDTQINIYYGNALAVNGEHPKNVWVPAYTAVYHMNDTGAPVTDSTSNFKNSTGTNGNPLYGNITSDKGYSIFYHNPADAHVVPQLASNAQCETYGFSISCWVYFEDIAATDHVVMGLYNDKKSQMYEHSSKASVYIEADGGVNNWADGTTVLLPNVWYYFTGVFDKANTDLYIYLNGRVDGSELSTDAINTAAFTDTLGNTRTYGWGVKGPVDEERFYLGVLNATYINVSFRTQNGSVTMLIIGAEHAPFAITTYINYTYYSPVNESTDVCLPCFVLSVNITFYNPGSPTFIRWETNATGAWVYMLNYTINPSTGLYQFEPSDHFVNLSNSTYWWRVYAKTGTTDNTSEVMHFTTLVNNSGCCGGGGSSASSIQVIMPDNNLNIIGIIGIIGMFGFIIYRRRKRR